MKLFPSQLDTKSEEYKKRRSNFLRLLSELNLREKEIREPSAEAVKKLAKRGKYPAREKIRRILDPGSEPLEIGLFAAWNMYQDIPGGYPSAGTIVQIGRVSGKLAVIVANDPLVKSGAWVEITCKKNLRA
ncbi:methylcrotonoyl-CoA carboxylase, partial [candidate division KSB1 bacterium]